MTRKFMFRYLPVKYDATVVARIAAGGKPPPFLVEVFDGEKCVISENVATWWVKGEPVELPESPCERAAGEAWLAEFWKSHPIDVTREGSVAENVGFSDSMCVVISPAG